LRKDGINRNLSLKQRIQNEKNQIVQDKAMKDVEGRNIIQASGRNNLCAVYVIKYVTHENFNDIHKKLIEKTGEKSFYNIMAIISYFDDFGIDTTVFNESGSHFRTEKHDVRVCINATGVHYNNYSITRENNK